MGDYDGGLAKSFKDHEDYNKLQDKVAGGRKMLANLNLIQAMWSKVDPAERPANVRNALTKIPTKGEHSLHSALLTLASEMSA